MQIDCRCNMKQEDNYKIRNWVEDLPKRGIITFSIEEVYNLFPSISKRGIANALLRLATKGKILSVWKGFYVVIPIEYAHKGVVPPIVYINQLMEYLKRQYYIGCSFLLCGSTSTSASIHSDYRLTKRKSIREKRHKDEIHHKEEYTNLFFNSEEN